MDRLKYRLGSTIDWDRLWQDFVNGLLGKLGSFAEDWYYLYGLEEGQVEVSQPGLHELDIGNDDFTRIQNVVLRKLKLCASQQQLFFVHPWKIFYNDVLTGRWTKKPYNEITDEMAEKAIKTGEYEDYHVYGKLPYLKHDLSFIWEREYFHLDDFIALHRNGKYILPGQRVYLADLRYRDDD